MLYNFSEDLRVIREALGITQTQFAQELGIQQVTVSRSESGKTHPSGRLLELVYGYAYENNVMLNRLKSMFWSDKTKRDHSLLFHGAKSLIDGEIKTDRSRSNNDFGKGFYTGETYSQAISFISGFDSSSIYLLDFNPENLKYKEFGLNQDWMLTIAYFRRTLDKYENHPLIKKLVSEVEGCDYIIAPIADNRMYQIINSFIDGEITDKQCMNCLAAANLGKQFVFKSNKAVCQLAMLERLYVSSTERSYYKAVRSRESEAGDEKVRQARIRYRGKGLYIDEILK